MDVASAALPSSLGAILGQPSAKKHPSLCAISIRAPGSHPDQPPAAVSTPYIHMYVFTAMTFGSPPHAALALVEFLPVPLHELGTRVMQCRSHGTPDALAVNFTGLPETFLSTLQSSTCLRLPPAACRLPLLHFAMSSCRFAWNRLASTPLQFHMGVGH
ncbi:uncharacterized protein IWZ02DRAFT_441362 [Phyllosticta citriasiana]|uniref:uncharacterized protein n=1 Tax=Phyllosticta citriasiana TaxID=595635 RepID=UPI0030FD5433